MVRQSWRFAWRSYPDRRARYMGTDVRQPSDHCAQLRTHQQPNSKLDGKRPHRKVYDSLGVSYDSDLSLVRAVLLEIAKRSDDVLEDPAPAVVVTGLGIIASTSVCAFPPRR